MSKNNNKPIDNAEEVIERFGGIRPLAHKIDVPVTTVQGWKKRNKIPAGRRSVILEAAAEYNVDLSDLMHTSPPANENLGSSGQTQKPFEAAPVQAGSSEQNFSADASQNRDTMGQGKNIEQSTLDAYLVDKLSEVERRAVNKSVIINGILVGLAVCAMLVLLWPSASEEERLKALESEVGVLETDVQGVKDDQSLLSGLIPQDLDAQIDSLREQAAKAQEKMEGTLAAAEKISQDVMAQDGSSMEERLAKLETHVVELTGSPFLAGMLQRVEGWQGKSSGERTLSQSIDGLSQALAGVKGTGAEQINAALEAARTKNDAVAETFEGVPTNELKAAALLLGMSQMRSSLNRDSEPFEDDLALLSNLVGNDDPALNEALARLAPKAKEGVLTPDGLSTEFRSLAGDIVVSSLKGEDVSIQEKARSRFNDLLQIEKDGELLTGTSTQATLLKTEHLLDNGDLAGAIAHMQTLEGPAAQTAQPWLEEAQATLLAQQIKGFLSGSIARRAYGQNAVDAITANGGLGNSTLIRNNETGINFLKRDKNIFDRKKPVQYGQ